MKSYYNSFRNIIKKSNYIEMNDLGAKNSYNIVVHCQEPHVRIDEFIEMVKEDEPIAHESG